MAAADTNVMLRLLVADHPTQTAKAEAYLAKHGPLWVSGAVLTETVWALTSVFEWDKARILAMLEAALASRDFTFQDPAAVASAVNLYAKAKAGFVDCLAVEVAKAHGEAPIATFDKAALLLPGTVAP